MENNNTRYFYNNYIIVMLKNYLEKYPDMRFNQALHNLNIVNNNVVDFYEESEVTLERIQASAALDEYYKP